MSKVCVPGGQVPLRTLVRVFDLQIFTIIDGFARLEPPHGRAQPELNPHTLPLLLSAAEYLVQSSARTSSIVPPDSQGRPASAVPAAAAALAKAGKCADPERLATRVLEGLDPSESE